MFDEAVREIPIEATADFDAFYRREYLGVLRVACAITGDRHVGAEVTHDAFVICYRRWQTVATFDQAGLWVRRVAINRALSWRRRVANEAKVLARLATRRPTPEDHELERDQAVWRHVRGLPRRQRSLIVLVYVGDLSVEQAAAALGIGIPTAKTHLQRARRTLATHLEEDTSDD